MPNAPALLIAGCGDIGSRVGLRLATQGWRVQGLRRHVAGLPSAIQPLYADLASPHCPEDWPQTAPDYVLYAVAAQQRDEAGYRAAYVEGLRNLLGWLNARGQRPRRLLFVSSTAVYAQQAGEWVDEHAPCEPSGFNGQVMLEAERLALGSGVPASVVRLAGLYGPHSRMLLDQVRAGLQVQSEPPLFANRIHRDDAAGLLAYLLQADAQGRVLDDCYLGVDDEPAALHEVVAWLREQLGIGNWAEQALGRRAGSKRCSNARARALGWRPEYPSYREGYAALLTHGQ
ncbi:NAD-dependent epimerase/dehydratase family protein [Pseudomonas sp.]|uniref:NAD-dependent epimerase/dehydratase family protein n=1 Tax=Pseudomonas sp. TaxID=306 RepID=UPI001A026EC6|nr:NAD-dependent epimerase/dehydratase family protein [Pseudomonas sp.]MBF0677264.1 NAD-dependent epimerase/dehydratase family protein [Pseudomonas sp.]